MCDTICKIHDDTLMIVPHLVTFTRQVVNTEHRRLDSRFQGGGLGVIQGCGSSSDNIPQRSR